MSGGAAYGEAGIQHAIAGFQAAGMGQGSWEAALDRLAVSTGSRSGQLIGIGADRRAPFNLISNLDVQAPTEWEQMGGADPTRNARVRTGLRSSEMVALGEAEFATEADLRSPVYDFYRRWDIAHTCQATLIHDPGLVVGLSVLRGEGQGQVTGEARRIFETLLPYAQQAVRLRMALTDEGARLLAGTMDAVSLAAFVLDRAGRVRAMSPSAQALATRGTWLDIGPSGQLRAVGGRGTSGLSEAVRRAIHAQASNSPPVRHARVMSRTGEPLVLEIVPIPKVEHDFAFSLGALVIARTPANLAHRAASLARALYGLTAAEAGVAGDLVAGLAAEEIARERRIGISTVRTHVRRILAKADVRRQGEFVGRIASRL